MKRKILMALVLSLAGYQKQAEASLAKRYFPLNVGNSWTYTNYFAEEPNVPGPGPAPPPPPPPGPPKVEFTFTIIGTEEIDGYTYYKFDNYFYIGPPPPNGDIIVVKNVLFRYDPIENTILTYRSVGDDIIRYNFTGDEWYAGGMIGWCRIRQTDVVCDVPAGKFSDCVNFQFGGSTTEPDYCAVGEYLAPNVGLIKFVIPGGDYPDRLEGQDVTFMLKSYTVIPRPAIQVMVDLDPDLFEVEVKAHKKPRRPKGEFLRAFIELPADVNVSDVNVATVNLCLNDTILAAAESPLIVDNILDVLFRLDPHNVGAILGLEVTKVKVDECRIEVTASAAPSQHIDLIELTVSGDFLYPGSFTGTDTVRAMLVNDERQKR